MSSMNQRTRQRLKSLTRIHHRVLFVSFALYLGLSFSVGPEFFVSDVGKKLHALADDIIVVTAVVLGPPAQPVVLVTPVCVSGSPRLLLDWSDDAATETWSIERDGLPLTTGLTVSQYADSAVTTGVAYTYVVTAYGPMSPGVALSVPIVATAPDCPLPLPDPSVTFQTFDGRNITTDRNDIRTTAARPAVTGITDIPGASVALSVDGSLIVAYLTANANGYFSWQPPVDLAEGAHTLHVTVTDPQHVGRSATDAFGFTRDGRGGGKSGGSHRAPGGSLAPVVGLPPAVGAFDFSLQVENDQDALFQGDDLIVKVTSRGKEFPVGTVFGGAVLDVRGREILHLSEAPVSGAGERALVLTKNIPLSIDPAEYRVRVDGTLEGRVVSHEAPFDVHAWPLLSFGPGLMITYPQVASFAGLIFSVLLFFALFFQLLFVREYWASLHALRHVTERHLARLGLIAFGKGVRK